MLIVMMMLLLMVVMLVVALVTVIMLPMSPATAPMAIIACANTHQSLTDRPHFCRLAAQQPQTKFIVLGKPKFLQDHKANLRKT